MLHQHLWMEDQEKYYKPDLQDLNWGCELFCKTVSLDNGDLVLNDEYAKHVISNTIDASNILNHEFDSNGVLISSSIPDCLYMKYLDKEDIEECGFSYKDQSTYYRKIDSEHTGNIYLHKTRYHGEVLSTWIIETDTIILHRDGSFDRNGIKQTIFNGQIKNKSELKKLLKTLLID